MYAVARLLQMIGLTIPPLAIIGQLNQAIDVRQMLILLVAAIAVFGIGYVLQHYRSGGPR